MVASIGVVASPSQGVSYYQRHGYYAKDNPAHLEASAWAGKGAEALELFGPVDPAAFQAILEGKVPDGPHLGRRGKDGEVEHRPGRDVTMSAPKSVSLVAMVGGDERIVDAHDRAVRTTLGWVEKNAVLTRMQHGTTGAMVHAQGGQGRCRHAQRPGLLARRERPRCPLPVHRRRRLAGPPRPP